MNSRVIRLLFSGFMFANITFVYSAEDRERHERLNSGRPLSRSSGHDLKLEDSDLYLSKRYVMDVSRVSMYEDEQRRKAKGDRDKAQEELHVNEALRRSLIESTHSPVGSPPALRSASAALPIGGRLDIPLHISPEQEARRLARWHEDLDTQAAIELSLKPEMDAEMQDVLSRSVGDASTSSHTPSGSPSRMNSSPLSSSSSQRSSSSEPLFPRDESWVHASRSSPVGSPISTYAGEVHSDSRSSSMAPPTVAFSAPSPLSVMSSPGKAVEEGGTIPEDIRLASIRDANMRRLEDILDRQRLNSIQIESLDYTTSPINLELRRALEQENARLDTEFKLLMSQWEVSAPQTLLSASAMSSSLAASSNTGVSDRLLKAAQSPLSSVSSSSAASSSSREFNVSSEVAQPALRSSSYTPILASSLPLPDSSLPMPSAAIAGLLESAPPGSSVRDGFIPANHSQRMDANSFRETK